MRRINKSTIYLLVFAIILVNACNPRFVMKDRMNKVKRFAVVSFGINGFIPWAGEPMRKSTMLFDAMSIAFNEVRLAAVKANKGKDVSLSSLLSKTWDELKTKGPEIFKKMLTGGIVPGGSIVSEVENSFIKGMNKSDNFSFTKVNFKDSETELGKSTGFNLGLTSSYHRSRHRTRKGHTVSRLNQVLKLHATPNGQPYFRIHGSWGFFGGMGSRGPTEFGNKPLIKRKNFTRFWESPELSSYDGFIVAQSWTMERIESGGSAFIKSLLSIVGAGSLVEAAGKTGTYLTKNRTELYGYDKKGLIWYDYRDGVAQNTFTVAKGVVLNWDSFKKSSSESFQNFASKSLDFVEDKMAVESKVEPKKEEKKKVVNKKENS